MDDDASNIDGLEAVRRRPEMYLGPIDSDDAMSVFVEHMLCPALDHALDGRCTVIALALAEDGAISMLSDCPGFSLEPEEDGIPQAQRMMTGLEACRAARHHRQLANWHCTAGLAVVTALSDICHLEIRQHGIGWMQRYRHGKPLGPFERTGGGRLDGICLAALPDRKILPRRVNALDLRERLVHLSYQLPSTMSLMLVEDFS
jgi:DNA gyrase/topoisomerase IV subunit B